MFFEGCYCYIHLGQNYGLFILCGTGVLSFSSLDGNMFQKPISQLEVMSQLILLLLIELAADQELV